jgi:hypothetical protein
MLFSISGWLSCSSDKRALMPVSKNETNFIISITYSTGRGLLWNGLVWGLTVLNKDPQPYTPSNLFYSIIFTEVYMC